MQKIFVKIISKKILTTAFLTGAVASVASAENGSVKNNIEAISPGIQSDVEFTGVSENTFLFDVKVVNPAGETITVKVQNDNGDVLFSEKYSDENIFEKIRLLNDAFLSYYNFIIKPENKNTEHSFVVSITTKAAEDAEAA